MVDFAIPRSKIQEASDELKLTGSSRRWARLTREASSLFTDLAKTGEGGELILFVLAEHVFKLPQIICKMSLKTSGHVHYHGADGVHASVDSQDGSLCLHWGESKMYSDPKRLINERIDYLTSKDRAFKVAAVIRGVMADVEELASFKRLSFCPVTLMCSRLTSFLLESPSCCLPNST